MRIVQAHHITTFTTFTCHCHTVTSRFNVNVFNIEEAIVEYQSSLEVEVTAHSGRGYARHVKATALYMLI